MSCFMPMPSFHLICVYCRLILEASLKRCYWWWWKIYFQDRHVCVILLLWRDPAGMLQHFLRSESNFQYFTLCFQFNSCFGLLFFFLSTIFSGFLLCCIWTGPHALNTRLALKQPRILKCSNNNNNNNNNNTKFIKHYNAFRQLL